MASPVTLADMNSWKRFAIFFLPACLAVYALSFGPALRLFFKSDLTKRKLDAIYRPFLVPGLPRSIILPYARLWAPYGVPFASWKAPYTEEEVGAFLKPGTPREAITKRFGQPMSVQRDPTFEDGSKPFDEILYFIFLTTQGHATYGETVFGGFQVNLKDGKVVGWSPISISG